MTVRYPASYLLQAPKPTTLKETKPMSTIKSQGPSYVVTRPDGSTIKCHNYQTALFYVRNPQAK